MNEKRKLNVRDIVFIGMLSAMCTIATTIKIPFGVGAMVHLGSAFLYTTGIVFGGVYAGLAGAIGSAFYDLLMGFSPYTVWSFLIKGVAGFIAGSVAKGIWPEVTDKISSSNTLIIRAFFACILAALWTLIGYIMAWWYVTGSFTTAVANIPSSLLTSSAGLIVALLLGPKLRKILKQ